MRIKDVFDKLKKKPKNGGNENMDSFCEEGNDLSVQADGEERSDVSDIFDVEDSEENSDSETENEENSLTSDGVQVDGEYAPDGDSDLMQNEESNEERAVVTGNELVSESGVDALNDAQPVETKKRKAVRIIKKYCNRYFIEAFTGMAQGLFCTLIAGTILAQIASWCGKNSFASALNVIASLAKMLMGAGIGVGIAHKLKAKPLVIFTAAVTGMIGAFSGDIVNTLVKGTEFVMKFGLPGNPIGAYVVALLTIEIAGLYAGKTKLDIVLIPLGMLVLCFAGIFLAWPFIKLIDLLAKLIVLAINAGTAVKVIVGIFVAVIMGILLTMPTSSAAIWVAIATSATALANPEAFGIAGGAAVAGCSAHMIGFAVATFKQNKVSGLISQGIGTSMLQIPNIMKKPLIMVPEIIASAFSGLVAVLIGIRCNAAGGGMGTSGLVGVFGTVEASMAAGVDTWRIVVGIIFCLFVIPAVISWAFTFLFLKKGWIKDDDLKLEA